MTVTLIEFISYDEHDATSKKKILVNMNNVASIFAKSNYVVRINFTNGTWENILDSYDNVVQTIKENGTWIMHKKGT